MGEQGGTACHCRDGCQGNAGQARRRGLAWREQRGGEGGNAERPQICGGHLNLFVFIFPTTPARLLSSQIKSHVLTLFVCFCLFFLTAGCLPVISRRSGRGDGSQYRAAPQGGRAHPPRSGAGETSQGPGPDPHQVRALTRRNKSQTHRGNQTNKKHFSKDIVYDNRMQVKL